MYLFNTNVITYYVTHNNSGDDHDVSTLELPKLMVNLASSVVVVVTGRYGQGCGPRKITRSPRVLNHKILGAQHLNVNEKSKFFAKVSRLWHPGTNGCNMTPTFRGVTCLFSRYKSNCTNKTETETNDRYRSRLVNVYNREIREIKHDVTTNGKYETFVVSLQLSGDYSENGYICSE